MKTLFLDPLAWDLTLDSNGDIALAVNPYALAQDAASAIRTFIGEVYYDTTQGIPYFGSILGKFPVPIALMKAQFEKAALTVPEVVAANVLIASLSEREVTGQVQVTDQNGVISTAGF